MKSAFFLLLLLFCHGVYASDSVSGVSCEDSYKNLARAKVEENVFIEDRGLEHYRMALCCGFKDALENIEPGEIFLDVGSGRGKAIAQFIKEYRAKANFFGFKSKRKPLAIGVSVIKREDPLVNELRQANPDNLKFITGKFVEDIPAAEFGRPKIITDFFGALSYTEDFGRVLQTYLDVLHNDGKIFLYVGLKERNLFFKDGKQMNMLEFLKTIPDLKVEHSITGQSITLSKASPQVRLPKLRLKFYKAGTPPTREYEIIE
jgi:SAM-dependent methyltransferase